MASSSGGVPPGFRFHPTDEELLHYYLKKKVSFQKFDMEVIRDVDLNKMEPWDLQERCRIGSTPQNEWYFFSHKDRKYPTGSRTNRATNAGFWKATGRDKCIRNSFKKIGMRKTLVFYRGRAPHGQKTDWIMHEYRLEDAADSNINDQEYHQDQDGWVVCRVFKKKNLFKVSNNNNINNHSSAQGGSSSTTNMINSSSLLISADHHHFNNNNNTATSTSMAAPFLSAASHRSDHHQYYLLRQQAAATPDPDHHHHLMHTNSASLEALNNKHNSSNEVGLQYYQLPPTPAQYSNMSQAQLHLQSQVPLMIKGGAYDQCESGSDDVTTALRYQPPSAACEGMPCAGRVDHDHDHDHQWMLTTSTTSTTTTTTAAAPHHLDLAITEHHEHSSAQPAANTDAPSSNIHHPLSLRGSTTPTGEMDFWGYAK